MAEKGHCMASEVRFTRRDIRAWTNWSDSQLKNHCIRLAEMEYLLLHGGSRGHLLRYELLWDGGNGEESHLCGLLNVGEMKAKTQGDKRKSDLNNDKSALSLVQVRAKSGLQKVPSELTGSGLSAPQVCPEKNAVISEKTKTPLSPSPSLSASS